MYVIAPVCQGQTETDEPAAMFILEDGAKIQNAIIGATQAEGIHCRGACTILNVWWADVCEDAATFKQPRGDQISYGEFLPLGKKRKRLLI